MQIIYYVKFLKIFHWILTGIPQNLQINLGRIDIFRNILVHIWTWYICFSGFFIIHFNKSFRIFSM